MRQPNLSVILSHALIGLGFFFLYMHHVRIIFETRTNIQHLNQLESESMLRSEDALYYAFYKKLADGPDFWHGYEQLKNVTDIEYPHSINVLQRFQVLPELVTAYFFHIMRSGFNPRLQPMYFYLEFVWLMGGVTLLVLYLYGTLLSENVFGGIYGVISYLMFHSFAAKIYERPLARENFAFPFIFLQMFYLCVYIGRVCHRQKHVSRIFMVSAMSLFTAFSLVSWEFSGLIFTTQIMIVIVIWDLCLLPFGLANAFILDYALSHLLGNGLAFLISHGNTQSLLSWHLSYTITLFVLHLRNRLSGRIAHQSNYFVVKFLILPPLFVNNMQSKLVEMLCKTGLLKGQENTGSYYSNMAAYWTFHADVNFATNLDACNPLYSRIAWSELWQLIKTLIVKPYCMYGVVMLATFFRKWRKSNVITKASQEQRERARNYVLEDFLEENHVSMRDMSNKRTEQQLQKFFTMLEKCNHDYERFKQEKAKMQQEQAPQRDDFMQDIKRLKAQIQRISDKQRKEREQERGESNAKETAPSYREIPQSSAKDSKTPNENPNSTAKESENAKGTESQPEAEPESQPDSEYDAESSEPIPFKVTAKESANGKRRATRKDFTRATSKRDYLDTRYIYNILQMVMFTLFGLTVRKFFFLCFTQGCVMAPTLCSDIWYHRQRNVFWSVSLAVFLLSMFDPGMVNIREEYFPTRYNHQSGDLEGMLEWIKLNTERDAVFAGPIDIIGTVHLTTKRPIVNHAHLEMSQMAEPTEHVYSVYSRQQSSDIYNQYVQLKIQYLIISLDECSNEVRDDCDLLAIWDSRQPAFRKYPQFCHELLHKNVPSFLKVYANDNYGIIKLFSQSVQINLKHSKMPEMSI